MILRPGVHQFIYDIKNGDIRIYDVFRDGRIKETVAKNSETTFVEPNYAIRRLDEIIDIAEREADECKKIPFYSKISKTKVNILNEIRDFIVQTADG